MPKVKVSSRTEWMFHVEKSVRGIWSERHIGEVVAEDKVRCRFCQGDIKLYLGPKSEHHAQHVNGFDTASCSATNKEKAETKSS